MIVQHDLNDNIIAEYPTLSKAAEESGVEATNIRAVINGRRNTAGSFRWSERFEEIEEEIPRTEHTIEHEYGQDYVKFTGVLRDVEINSLEDLLEFTKVDLELWEVKNYTTKVWTTTMKRRTLIDSGTASPPIPGQGFSGKPLYEHTALQVTNVGFTVNFIPRTDFKARLVEVLMSNITPIKAAVNPKRKRGAKYIVEFAIFDHHLGKEGFDPETLKHNWSIDEAMDQYRKVIEFGLSKIDIDQVHEFILPTGNDLMNVDSSLGTTTSGTKVGSDTLWLNLFRYSKEAVSQAIQILQEYAPVKAIFIPGNHDHNGVLALSEVIKALYQHHDSVQVICNGRGREWYQFGKNLIGWHHGDRCDARKAHTMMIADVPHLIEKNQYRALHVGHTHRSAKTETITLNTLTEEFGLIYEICPSLTPLDKWHDTGLYLGNLRRSKIFGYEYDRGHEFEYIYNLK